MSGPVVRRSWKLVPGAQGPLLTGLFGFPWRDPVMQAKCTQTDISRPGELFSTLQRDRHHRWVPSLDCTCGIYATDDPTIGRLQRFNLRNSVIVNGFVRLSGRVLLDGNTYRAAEAQIVGPLTITPPPRRRLRRLGARWGVGQEIRRVTEHPGGFDFWYSDGRRGVLFGEWCEQMRQALNQRYAVEVTGLLPSDTGVAGRR